MKIALLLMMTTILTFEPLGALATELTSLSPGMNEIRFKHDGRSRRLIVTTPQTFAGQGLYPVLFCFHGAGGKADGPSKRWSPHADTYANQSGIEVAFCKVKGQGHFIRRDLRDIADSVALDFFLRHKRR